MTLFDPDPSIRWLFCMTHPDDEISIAVWIQRLVKAGCPVFLSWSHSTPRREREGRKVAKMLGVPESNLHFFGAPDRAVLDQIPTLLPEYIKWMEKVKPDRVACGAFEQGHLDHDATNYLVNHSFKGPVLEIPFYHAYLKAYMKINRFADPAGQQILLLSAEEELFKKSIAKQYKSQRIWWNLWWYEVGQAFKFHRPELAKSERMRIQTYHDWLTPNLPQDLRQKVEVCAKWQRWTQALKKL